MEVSPNIKQRSPEWFAARQFRVTGSNVGAILGVDPNRTRADVMRAMVRGAHGADKEWEGNIATRWGQTHEPEAREDFERMSGLTVEDASFVVHPTLTWLGASPDGYIGEDAVYEAKCPFGKRKITDVSEFKSLDDQTHYYAQMQIEMLVTGRSKCYFQQWAPGCMVYQIVHADPSYQDTIIPILKGFHDEFLRECEKPDDHLQAERIVIDTPRAAQLLAEYDDLCDAEAKAKERKAEIVETIVELAKGRNAIFGGRKLTKVEKEGSISYASAVKALLPGVDLSKWRGKPSSFWKIS